MEVASEEDVSAVAFSLIVLAVTYRFHPIEIADGKLGNDKTDIRLTFDDITYIANICLNSTHSVFESGLFAVSTHSNTNPKTKHYAMAIEWLEAAEL